MAHHIAVVIGGGPIGPSTTTFDAVIAADSGYDAAVAAGLTPTYLVGDLDSISGEGLSAASAAGIPIEPYDPDKDHTDTTLALHRAVALGATHVTLLGPATSDRLDHLIGALTALGDPALAGCEVTGELGGSSVRVLHPGQLATIDLPAAGVFSLLALHGVCEGVRVVGARWPLDDARLVPASTLGVSNASLGHPVRIGVREGVLTIIVPHHDTSPNEAP
ncbi:MAG: thiamine diphosphokinase [Ilumatobacteraceae bacterium]